MSVETSVTQYRVSISRRQILSIALPISLAILVPQINFITNNIFLGHLSEEALATAGITGVYYLIFAVIGNGINNGLQALIARRAGEERIEEIGILFWQGVRIVLVLSALGIAFTYILAPTIMRLSLRSGRLSDEAIAFLRIRIWGLPFLYIYQLRNALLVGTNQSRLLIYGTAGETLTNILLDYGFIFGHWGLPAMGFHGAALASVCAEAAGMLVVFGVIESKGVSRRLQLYRHRRYNRVNLRLVLVQSSPLIFQYAISIISWEFFYILIEHHGQRDLAISNTMRNIFGMFGAFTWAFASTTNMMVSNIIGQGRKDQVLRLIGKIVGLSLGFSLIVAILLNLFPVVFLSMFGQSGEFIAAAIPVVRVVSTALVMMSFATVWLNAVTGTGNTRVNLAIESITIIFYSLYVYYVLDYLDLPILYGWMSEWLYWSSTFILSFLYMRSGRWKEKKV